MLKVTFCSSLVTVMHLPLQSGKQQRLTCLLKTETTVQKGGEILGSVLLTSGPLRPGRLVEVGSSVVEGCESRQGVSLADSYLSGRG